MTETSAGSFKEPHRLAALLALQITDRRTAPWLDRIVAIASQALDTKFASVNFIDGTTCWNSACLGHAEGETDRSQAFCNVTIHQDDVLVIPDAAADDRYNRFQSVVTQGIRFYAGAPITTSQGARIGAVAVFDTLPRAGLTHEERATLIDLAALVAIHFESGTQARIQDLSAEQARIAHYLNQIAAAQSSDEAIARVLTESLGSFGGYSGRLWKMGVDAQIEELCCCVRAGHDIVRVSNVSAPNSIVASVIKDHRAHHIRIGDIAGALDPLGQIMHAEGTSRAIVLPTLIGDRTFVFLMTFDNPIGDIAIAQEMQRLADGLAPVWRQQEPAPQGDMPVQTVPLINAKQRRTAEQEDRDRGASFRLMFDNNPLPMVLYVPDTFDIHRVNDAVMTTYGYDEQGSPRSVLDLLAQEEQPQAFAFIGKMGGRPAQSAWTHVRADGERMRVQVVSHPVTFDGTQLRLAVVWDVTEIEQARDALRQSNQELLILAGQLQARTADLTEVNRRARLGMWRLPPGDGAAEWSAEMWEIFGRPANGAGPDLATLLTWIAPGDRVRVREVITQAAELRTAQSFEFRAIQPRGTMRYCLADLRPDFGASSGRASLKGFCQDVTERKETELALLRSEKLKTIGQFTGGVAHDFNNLLTVIMLNVEEVIDMLDSEDPIQPLLAPVLHAATRGSQLTSQLLSYARRSPLEPMHVSMHDLFNGLTPLLDRVLGDRFTIEIRYSIDLVEPFVDAAKLENALLNLVINARDAMTTGGKIVISTAIATLDPQDGSAWTDFVPGDYAAISVMDTGCGIPADLVPQVFEPFFTTKAVGKGSGLGLSMVYGFAKQSGGHVAITSDVSIGTTATLYLPLRSSSAVVPWRTERRASTAVAPRMSALLVEDQPDVLETLQRQLMALGFKVIVAADATRAMDHITAIGILDLLFTDVAIPGPIDGTQLAAIARQRHPEIKILLTSGYLDQNAAEAADLAGGTEFLQKPYTRADLSERLAAMFPAEGVPASSTPAIKAEAWITAPAPPT